MIAVFAPSYDRARAYAEREGWAGDAWRYIARPEDLRGLHITRVQRIRGWKARHNGHAEEMNVTARRQIKQSFALAYCTACDNEGLLPIRDGASREYCQCKAGGEQRRRDLEARPVPATAPSRSFTDAFDHDAFDRTLESAFLNGIPVVSDATQEPGWATLITDDGTEHRFPITSMDLRVNRDGSLDRTIRTA